MLVGECLPFVKVMEGDSHFLVSRCKVRHKYECDDESRKIEVILLLRRHVAYPAPAVIEIRINSTESTSDQWCRMFLVALS